MIRYLVILPLLVALPVEAGPFKCRLPDGSIVYQQSACAGAAEGAEMSVDTRSPGGSSAGSGRQSYSVESQLKAMESTREHQHKARTQAVEATRKSEPSTTYDRAKCAKHRAEVARWERTVRNGYRNQREKAYDQHMLEYHQALADRHCQGE